MIPSKTAVAKAIEGHRVVMVSSGDPGVYGMAGIVLEVAAKEKTDLPVEIVPGPCRLTDFPSDHSCIAGHGP